ncbi:hypothetical protein SAMN06264364_105179 [Quadrisphaera granulorum]|uniref:Polyketide cyclase/dehydrase/lipid transport protein n=1 Tax=Quadrisphaera granulorum TaxID=317664 RepID=A0A316ADC4_9ACTN|nr:hypothetical protein [Quadrisphaera granulorum]PWJ54970.1 hypothetical protein BXY45_105179 [Quadrisphaera granulorum]SZE95916.1 hypothetical protein SAMN06264364_105179 [Quadrisphaera granulorum]
MIEVGSRTKNQPAPPWAVFEALVDPHRDPSRPWLTLLDDEIAPVVVEEEHPRLVVWTSLWQRRPDARVRFDVLPAGPKGGTDLRWTLLVEEPAPDAALVGHLRKRLNQLINAELRYSFGQ